MVEFIMLMGLPGSGKSTYAKQIAQEKNAIIMSSDALRMEMFGCNCQDKNDELFKEMNKRVIGTLQSGTSVVYDATNTNSKRRYNLLRYIKQQKLDSVWKECHYLNNDLGCCLLNDMNRENAVGQGVILRMRNSLQTPMSYEGWDDIIVKTPNALPQAMEIFKQTLSAMNDRLLTLDEYEHLLNSFALFGLLNLCQDNLHHTLTVGRHSYEVYKHIHENYFGEDREIMLLAGLLHDVGKQDTKEFLNGSKYATFRGHDNVSAQVVLQKLKQVNYPKALQVAEIIQLHMRLSWRQNEDAITSNNVLYKLIGPELFEKLMFFRTADMSGK